MSGGRKNTLVIDFSVLPVRPDAGKVQKFVENQIKLNFSDIKNIQLHNIRNCVLIEMTDEEVALRYQKAHNYKHRFLCEKKEFKIPVFVDYEAVTVRVHDLPPTMPHTTVMDYMAKFGEVIYIRHERWKHYFPGVLNGVRVLRMQLKHAIPSFITIENEETMVTYPKQAKTCRHCARLAHPKQKCLESAAATNTTTSSPAAPSTDGAISLDDFPPINNEPNNQTTSAPTSPEFRGFAEEEMRSDTDSPPGEKQNNDDGSSSSTTSDFIEVTNKRRLSKQKENEKKKVCAEQCSQNAGQLADRSEENSLPIPSGDNVFLIKNKSGKGSKCVNSSTL